MDSPEPGPCRHTDCPCVTARRAVDALERIATGCSCHGDASYEGLCGPSSPAHTKRPGKSVGSNRGDLDGSPLTVDYLSQDPDPGSWPGERTDLRVPLLFLRANPGDVGARPVVGPFWESPDIYVLAGVHPNLAPDVPPTLGQTAEAEADNTLYAHIWNFGQGGANDIVVEFFWADPSMGINPSSVRLIGQTYLALGSRTSGASHAIVKCPEPWRAHYTNGGHECLIVRAWTLSDDRLSTPEWDASLNRHVAQRNIHVVSHAESGPVAIRVGPLYGAGGSVRVDRIAPAAMPWLQLHTGIRGQFPATAPSAGQPALTAPTAIGSAPPSGPAAPQHTVVGDDQHVTFTPADPSPGPGQANVYRVTTAQDGTVVGGYTVVVAG